MSTTTIEYLTINIPTYPWSGSDKEAPFIREFTPRGQPIYPYTSMEKISDQKEDREYKAVILENEFLKLTFLPEMNGRLYSAFDKVNKRDMFYNNPQMKPSLFGLRGAWCANGVEYNFPNSHSTTTLEPIEFKAVKNNDGSASFICGDCERVGRMLWSVEVILRPGHAAIEMQTRLYNPTAYPKRFYYWMNAAVPLFQETQFIYPESTQRLYTHPPMDISRIAYLDYPVHEGHDISLFKNIPQHFPVFAEEMEEDFFGVYHHNLDSGVVHVADHALVRGRKIWMFGNQRDGRIWIDLLTDSGIDYCEVQTGPFSLQSDYRLLAPGTMHVQKDSWLPVNHLGGFNAASEKLVANIKNKGGKVSIKLNPVCDISDASIVVSSKGKVSGEKKMSLKALKTEDFILNCNSPLDYSVEIFDANRNSLLHYSPVIEKKLKPVLKDQPRASTYLEGKYWEQQGCYDRAYTFYSEDKAASSVIAKARMDMDAGLFEKAFKDLQDVLTLDPENAEALLYTSRCLKQLGKYKQAETCLSRSCDNTPFIQDAILQLAEISVLQTNYTQAKERLEHLAENYQTSAYAAALYALVLRKTGDKERADKALKHVEEIHPFEPFIYGETFLLKGNDILKDLRGQVLLEIVTRYMNLNQNKDALRILDTYLKTADSVLPLMWYYKAYLGKTDVPESLNGEWDFIFRNESENILKYALKKNPDDYPALYHLGNFYANKRRWQDALECWRKVKHYYDCKSLALRAEGVYWWKVNGNTPKAVECYKQAVNLENCGAKTVWEYDHLLEEIGET
jgi:tetratricopeptide (TPR) repeat protein